MLVTKVKVSASWESIISSKEQLYGKNVFYAFEQKKKKKNGKLSGIRPYRIVSIAILYSKDFLFLFWSFRFLSYYRGGPHVNFSLSMN